MRLVITIPPCHVAGALNRLVDAKTVKSSILAFLTLLSLSPVMKTLTASTSSDSIWALAACLFILNALIADYSSPRPGIYTRERCDSGHYVYSRARGITLTVWSRSLTSVLSINAAISASVVLASRLPDDISVFALMLYAVVLFAMFPVLRHRLQVSEHSPSGITHGVGSYRPQDAEPIGFDTEADIYKEHC